MKKYLIVKQTHRYTKEKNLLFQGTAEVRKTSQNMMITYMEQDGTTQVSVCADEQLHLKREGEFVTDLNFCAGGQTTGNVLSEFGTIELGIYTHKYIRKDDIIALEYDVISNGEVTDGYRILWIMKEDQA